MVFLFFHAAQPIYIYIYIFGSSLFNELSRRDFVRASEMSGFGDRLSQRQKAFKKGVDADDARRKREDAAVQLRKQTRDEALMKKRMVNDLPPGGWGVRGKF